jgi:hypothetical protein
MVRPLRTVSRSAVVAVITTLMLVSPAVAGGRSPAAEVCVTGGVLVPPSSRLGNIGDGYMLDKGRFNTIVAPGARETLPYGINNRGVVVGGIVGADGRDGATS